MCWPNFMKLIIPTKDQSNTNNITTGTKGKNRNKKEYIEENKKLTQEVEKYLQELNGLKKQLSEKEEKIKELSNENEQKDNLVRTKEKELEKKSLIENYPHCLIRSIQEILGLRHRINTAATNANESARLQDIESTLESVCNTLSGYLESNGLKVEYDHDNQNVHFNSFNKKDLATAVVRLPAILREKEVITYGEVHVPYSEETQLSTPQKEINLDQTEPDYFSESYQMFK